MHIPQGIAAVGAAQQGHRANHDQQGFQAFAQQDGERPQERGLGVIGTVLQQGIDLLQSRFQLLGGGLRPGHILAADGCAVLQHGRLHRQHQRFVTGRHGRLQRLKPIEVGRQTQAHSRRRVPTVQSSQALLQPQARQGRAGGLARIDHLGVRPQIGQRRAAIGLGQGFFDTGRRGGGQRPHLTEVVAQGGIGLPLLLALLF